jgi:hypothetical protein
VPVLRLPSVPDVPSPDKRVDKPSRERASAGAHCRTHSDAFDRVAGGAVAKAAVGLTSESPGEGPAKVPPAAAPIRAPLRVPFQTESRTSTSTISFHSIERSTPVVVSSSVNSDAERTVPASSSPPDVVTQTASPECRRGGTGAGPSGPAGDWDAPFAAVTINMRAAETTIRVARMGSVEPIDQIGCRAIGRSSFLVGPHGRREVQATRPQAVLHRHGPRNESTHRS